MTVAGVGDMSGDVFGNGMLLSRKLKLVAAFDHRDIFLDPDPDPETSFAERERLFDLPRSSWQDYDKALISKGGGVFSRSAKSIPLSDEIRAMLGIDKAEATPAEVMSAILKAPVGLLWFGGIGTYIRAASETDEQVGDRANDAIRITGGEVRAKVIGEGANLGVTQRGRIEAAQSGRPPQHRRHRQFGRRQHLRRRGQHQDRARAARARWTPDARTARNALLVDMTDEVARLVLRNNYLQTLALSLSERRGVADLGFARRLMHMLEAQGRLDRAMEYLPDDATLTERARRGEALTRPELAVLLAYAKLVAARRAARQPRCRTIPISARSWSAISRPRCASASRTRSPRTACAARSSRRSSPTRSSTGAGRPWSPASSTRPGADAPTIAAAYAATRDSFGLTELNAAIDALDGIGAGQPCSCASTANCRTC